MLMGKDKKRVGVYERADQRSRKRPPLIAGMIVLTLTAFIGISITIASWTNVPEVARASGEISPTDDFRQIEAPEGGTVVSVQVREGDLVASGQVLATLSSSELSRQIAANTEELTALELRDTNHSYILEALNQDVLRQETISKDSEHLEFARSILNVLAAQTQSNLDLIQRLEANVKSQKQALIRLQTRRREKQEQVDAAQGLFDKGLTTKANVLASKDALSEVEDQIHALGLSVSGAQKDIEVLRAKLVQDRLELRERHVEEKFGVTQQRLLKETEQRTLQHRKTALEIVAPADGRIHSVGFPNEGEVIERGETLFELLPTNEALIAVLRLPTRDIGHIFNGMDVRLRLETFDNRTTQPLQGQIVSISPNRIYDRDLGEDYFRATVGLDQQDASFAAIEDRLSAGMVVSAEIVTRERSVMAYILKPIERSLSFAFNER